MKKAKKVAVKKPTVKKTQYPQGYSVLENALRVEALTQKAIAKYEQFQDILRQTENTIQSIDDMLSTIEI